MKGYETGILLRSKKGRIEDLGCSLPADVQREEDQTFRAF